MMNMESSKSTMENLNSTHYLEILGNLTNKPLERELPDEQLSTLLVLTDFTVNKIQSLSMELSSQSPTKYILLG